MIKRKNHLYNLGFIALSFPLLCSWLYHFCSIINGMLGFSSGYPSFGEPKSMFSFPDFFFSKFLVEEVEKGVGWGRLYIIHMLAQLVMIESGREKEVFLGWRLDSSYNSLEWCLILHCSKVSSCLSKYSLSLLKRRKKEQCCIIIFF